MPLVDKKRITKNSLVLYLRMLITLPISLWTVRIVLEGLGVEDYGIYNVVGGFVAMFGIVSSSLSASISRYITYELGTGNAEKLKTIFGTCVKIQFIISGLILALAETVGLWFVNCRLNVPTTQMVAVNWVFQFSVFTFLINLISVPYNATIIAHERMKIFAYVEITSAFAKIGVAYLLFVFSSQRLIIYALLLLLINLFIRIFYGFYCAGNFEETRGKAKSDLSLTKDIFGFAGWNFIGSISRILSDQGVNVLLNLFFGPIVNAARGVAMQVSGVATSFSGNFMTAINPQITKSFASNEKKESIELCILGSRMGFFLMYIIALPIIITAPILMKLWLKDVPEYSVIFVRLILINSLIEVLSNTLITLMLATGKIRNYQIIVGACNFLVLPLAYFVLLLDYPPQSAIIVGILMSSIALVCRLIMLKRMILLSIGEFIIRVILRIIAVVLVSLILIFPSIKFIHFQENSLQIVVVGAISLILTILSIYTIGLNTGERALIKKYCFKFLRKRQS